MLYQPINKSNTKGPKMATAVLNSTSYLRKEEEHRENANSHQPSFTRKAKILSQAQNALQLISSHYSQWIHIDIPSWKESWEIIISVGYLLFSKIIFIYEEKEKYRYRIGGIKCETTHLLWEDKNWNTGLHPCNGINWLYLEGYPVYQMSHWL